MKFTVKAVCLGLLFQLGIEARAQDRPIGILGDVGIDQKLNASIPLDLSFRDETGQLVHLRDYFGEKPVILSLVYFKCPMLCTMVLNGLVRSLRATSFDPGKEYTVLTVSFDPRETPEVAATMKDVYMNEYRRPGAERGWHFLTGEESSIVQLANAVGFRYKYDLDSGQWAHATGIMVLTPTGKVTQYFYGLEYSARDLRLSLIEAAANKIGSPVDQILLYCLHYDPAKGKYGVAIMNLMRLAGLATVLSLGALILTMVHRQKK